jgi:hypothetical protein
MKICALLVPREMKVEHAGGLKALSDEQLDQAIAALREMIAARAGEAANVIAPPLHLDCLATMPAEERRRRRDKTPPLLWIQRMLAHEPADFLGVHDNATMA